MKKEKIEKEKEYAFENFDWFKGTPHLQQRREPDTYVAFYNDIRRTIEPGE
jgi:hypothetical protein